MGTQNLSYLSLINGINSNGKRGELKRKKTYSPLSLMKIILRTRRQN